jgi:hypothetical protein
LAELAGQAHLRAMRMGNRDRRVVDVGACVVCGSTDTRLLSFTRLLEGARVPVCGSHKLAHHRSEIIARTVEELCALVGERRKAG